MRIVLVALHSSPVHHSLALPSLQAYLARHQPGFPVAVREFIAVDPPETVADAVVDQRADIVGISCAIWNIDAARRVTMLLRQLLPRSAVVFGGPEVVAETDEFFLGPGAPDAVVQGEGEATFAALVRAFADHGPAAAPRTPGVLHAADACADRRPEPAPPAELDTLPSPFLGGHIEPNRPFLYWETSRGCRFRCSFCLSSLEAGVRRFPWARIEAELDWMVAHQVPLVRVIDRTFNDDPECAARVIERILRTTPPSMRFHFEIDGYRLDPLFTDLCRSSPPGKFQFEVGVQCLDPDPLRAVHRSADTERLLEGLQRLTATTHVSLHCDLLVGLPRQNAAHVRRGLDELVRLRPDMLQIETVKLLRGTEMRSTAVEQRWPHEPYPPYRVLQTPWLPRADLRRAEAVARAVDRFRNPWYLRRFADATALRCGPPSAFWERFSAWRASAAGAPQAPGLSARARFRLMDRFLQHAVPLHGWDPLVGDDLRFAWYAFERPVPGVLRGVPARCPIGPDTVDNDVGYARATLSLVWPPGDEDAPPSPLRPLTEDRSRCWIEEFPHDAAGRLDPGRHPQEPGPAVYVFLYPRPDDPHRRAAVYRLIRNVSI